MKIPFNKPFITGKELDYIARAVEAAHISGDGPYTKLCHRWFEEHLGCRKSLLTHSCTAALEMAAILCNIQPGDEVILPSFTFVSTANAFVLRGGVPVFVDIRPDTLNIDERCIERAITSRTKAIVPVHYAGLACSMDVILEIAGRHKLWVIEDAAHALLAKYRDSYLGSIGHLGCLSFHETKNIISGEGGALLINHAEMIDRSEIIREKGTDRSRFFRGEIDKYRWIDIGSSFLPSELTAAFLYAQLEQADDIIRRRRKICRQYYELLRHLSEEERIRLPFSQENCMGNGHMFYVMTRSPEERAELLNFLRERSIGALFHYVPLHSSPAGLKYGRTSGSMAVTDDISGRILRLPMFYGMQEEEVEIVSKALYAFYIAK